MSPDELAAMWDLARRADGQQWLVVLDELEKATQKLDAVRIEHMKITFMEPGRVGCFACCTDYYPCGTVEILDGTP